MLNSNPAATSPARVFEVDTIRGLALFGICVVNVPFLAQPLNDLLQPVNGLDWVAKLLVEWLFQGKFFVLFSFLFGWGFAVQMAASERTGAAAHGRFLRRLLGLAAIGLAHATLVFFGDILLLYALLGLPLLALHKASLRVLAWTAVSALTVAACALFVLAVVISDVTTAPSAVASGAGYLGSFSDAVAQRLQDWPFALGFIAIFNGPIAFAAFCAGVAAAKVRFFAPGNGHYLALRRRLPLLLIVGLPINLLYALGVNDDLGTGLPAALAFSSLAIGGPCLGAVYLVGAVEAARRGLFQGATVAAGRMSLTAYVLEGVLAGLIFNGFGLGFYGGVGAFACLLIALGIYVVTHLTAALWLKGFAEGPLEWILRAMTRGSLGKHEARRLTQTDQ